MDKFAAMEIFVKTVEAGSFTAAAEALSLTPQGVGKQVAALEARLGVQLIRRTTRRQYVTEAGWQFYERCTGILDDVAAAEAQAAMARATPRGLLRLNAPIAYGSHVLAPRLPGYLRAHPEVSIDLRLSNRRVDLLEEGYDAVFRIGPLRDDSALAAKPLAPYRLLACAAPRYLQGAPPLHTPEDLRRHQCLIFAHSAWQSAWRFIHRDGEITTVPVQGRLQIDDNQALLNAALAGEGIVIHPAESLGDYLADGRLVRVLPDYALPQGQLHLLYAPDRRMTAKLRSFLDFAQAELAG